MTESCHLMLHLEKNNFIRGHEDVRGWEFVKEDKTES
jgi:hypothetical protein